MAAAPIPVLMITVKGIDALNTALVEIPNLGPDSIEPLIRGLAKRGVEVAQATLRETSTSVYRTGRTAKLMRSVIEKIQHPGEWSAIIGPITGHLKGQHRIYPYFVSHDTRSAELNRAVQLFPHQVRWGYNPRAVWRFLKTKPSTPRHPWMQSINEMVKDEAATNLGNLVYSKVAWIRKKVREAELKELARE